ncbi:hypothetical protein HZH66_009168 [Vespula vulgaris]|uniref:Uncharacterized protein n=1 Tax=Vespula vulgaris TaxID=7454 RepID=A0A834N2F8_VESVU|nr:hypothetical protein HZH66_009168 [Vespula vulgaris]
MVELGSQVRLRIGELNIIVRKLKKILEIESENSQQQIGRKFWQEDHRWKYTGPIDIIGLFPKSLRENRFLLVLVDCFRNFRIFRDPENSDYGVASAVRWINGMSHRTIINLAKFISQDQNDWNQTLEGHGHWVNTLALNVDYALRTGPFQLSNTKDKIENPLEYAKKQYTSVGEEKLVSGSDDFTLFLWKPEKEKKPIARMTGHQQLINDVKFSPDGRIIASASFDKSIKLWDSNTGNYIASLRGHVQAVYSITWSADSRLLLSGSADSTLKVWSMKTKKLYEDLPGHADEVYAVDWSPDGLRVASGGKDKVLKLWQN